MEVLGKVTGAVAGAPDGGHRLPLTIHHITPTSMEPTPAATAIPLGPAQARSTAVRAKETLPTAP